MKQLSACPSHKTAWHLILTLAAIMFACPTTTAENIFVEGTTWEYFISLIGCRSIENTEIKCTLRKIDDRAGRECLGVFVDRAWNDITDNLEMAIATEGDKVFAYDDSAADGEDPWRLMYDFGVQPGDKFEIYVFILDFDKPGFGIRVQPAEMECLIVRDPVDTHYLGNAQQIVVNLAGYDGQTVWTKGYGSAKGIFQNISANRFVINDISNPIMLRVSNGEDVYYEYDLDPDHIEPVAVPADDAGISIEGRTVTATAPMTIHSIDGRTVASGITEATVATPGVYIVSSGTARTKIAVR